MIKAVLVDIDNTLLHFDKCAKLAMSLAFDEFNLTPPKDFLSTFITINDGLWCEIEKGTLTKEGLHKIRFVKVLKALNVDFDGLIFEERFRHYLKSAAEKVDGADRLMQYLKKKYFIGLASNGHAEQQRKRLKISGLENYADALFISGEIGHEKPSAKFFEKALESLPTKNKDEIMIIGDSLTADIKGGIDFGIKTCWFNLKNQPCSSEIIPDYTVKTLEEIENIL
jgi:YjjG family noncanonical pyrimidine nucleotidase